MMTRWSHVAALLLCVQASVATGNGGTAAGNLGNVVHLALPRSMMTQETWPHADAHALVLPVLLDFQPVLLQLSSGQSIVAQLRWFCMQHGLDPGRCGVVMQQAMEELIETRGVVYCRRMRQSPPALLTVRNILLPASTSLYPPSYAWLHDEAINMASDLCGFLRTSIAQKHVDDDARSDCELPLQEAFDESFKWISSLSLCESDSGYSADQVDLSDRISTIEQMIESLSSNYSTTIDGTLNSVTNIASHDQKSALSRTNNVVPQPIETINSEDTRDALDIGAKNLTDLISTIEQMIASLHSENDTMIKKNRDADSSTVSQDHQEASPKDSVSEHVVEPDVGNQPGDNIDELENDKAERLEFHELKRNLTRDESAKNDASDNVSPEVTDSIEEHDEAQELSSTTFQVSEIKNQLKSSEDDSLDCPADDIEPNKLLDHELEPIIIEEGPGSPIEHIQNIEEPASTIAEETVLFIGQCMAAIRMELSAPWTVILTLALLLFIFYLALDLLSIGIHHLTNFHTRQAMARKLNIAFMRGNSAVSVLPKTTSTKMQPISVIIPANFKITNNGSSPPADAAGVISAKPRNEMRPATLVMEQRKAMLLKKMTKTYRRRTQKNAMGLWRSAPALNRQPIDEPEESQTGNLEPITNAQPTLMADSQSQETRSQLQSHAPSFTCAAMTLLFAHHAQYHLPVVKANTNEATCETPALIHSVSVQDIRQHSAAQLIQYVWRAKHKLLRDQLARKSQIAETKPPRKSQEKLRRQLPIFQLLHRSRSKRNEESNASLDAWTVPESDEFFSRMESPTSVA